LAEKNSRLRGLNSFFRIKKQGEVEPTNEEQLKQMSNESNENEQQ